MNTMNNSALSVPSSRSKKQLRIAKKAQRRHSGRAEHRPMSNTPETPEPLAQPEQPQPLEVYDCIVCLESVYPENFTITCDAHVVCDDCIPPFFSHALANLGEFPARCCTQQALQPKMYAHLLSPPVLEQYTRRAREHFTKVHLRVYCANPSCGTFIPRNRIFLVDGGQFADCHECQTFTCVGCKAEWENTWHVCDKPSQGVPDWLPEYTPECRIKRCPRCNIFVELKEACNHMMCDFCKFEFCFVCLGLWRGFHMGCLQYGDPEYDDEGFEVSARGLHRLTGLDRNGFDVYGNQHSRDNDAQAAGGERVPITAFENETELGRDILHMPGDDPIEDIIEEPVQFAYVRINIGLAGFEQLECEHLFKDFALSDGNFACCQFCKSVLSGGMCYQKCHWCTVRICWGCWLNGVHEYPETRGLDFMVGPIQWAEQGFPPFRTALRQEADLKDGEWGVKEMFERAEEDARLDGWWYDVVENVGLPGAAFTFRHDTNSWLLLESKD